MKKIFSTLAVALFSLAAMAQQPVITFEKTEHDFGKINEADGRVTTIFEFKNEGMEPLVLSNVRASCGCTTPKWTKEPIEPGQTGQITVTYNPNGRPGRFQKTITITSNATEATKKLYIKGEVIPKPAKPVNNYPVKMGELSLKAASINFGEMVKGQKPMLEIEYANLTDHAITVDLATSEKDNYIATQMTLATLQPKETGKLQAIFQSDICKTWGPVEAYVYVVVDGKKVITNEYKVTITGDVLEDFSTMSVPQKQAAPIANIENVINLGKVAAGKKAKCTFALQNIGQNPLQVRRIYTNAAELNITPVKGAIKNGKKTDIKVEVNAIGSAAGSYEREVIIITNDPKQPRKTVKFNWTVE